MNMDIEIKKGLKKFFDVITGLSTQEKLSLADFESRIHSLYDIKKSIRQMGVALRKFIETRNEMYQEQVLKKIISLKEQVVNKFWRFLEEERKDILSEEECVRKEKELEQSLEIQQLREYDKLKKGFAMLESSKRLFLPPFHEIEKKLSKILKEIEAAMEKEAVDISIHEHLEELIKLMKKVYQNQVEQVKSLYAELNKLEKEIKELGIYEDPSTIEEIMSELKIKYNDLDRELRTEKIQIIDPFYKFLRQKRRIHCLVKMHIEKSKTHKITRQDIIRDVHTFTDSNETHRYLNMIRTKYRPYLDDKAWNLIERVSRLAVESGEAKKFQLEELAGLASIDALTGIKNRRGFENDLNLLKDIDFISAIFIDIDDFRLFNNEYGHDVGDEVLKAVANFIKIGLDESKVYRYGGEEFVILLPRTSKKEAVAIAETTRKNVEQMSKKTMEKIRIKKGLSKIREKITISLGVATRPEDAKNINDLLAAADDAEKKAKDAGKNRVKHA